MTRVVWSKAAFAAVAACVLGQGSPARAAVKASDSASNAAYAAEADGAWKGQNPAPDENPAGLDDGGTGFDPWNFAGGYNAPPALDPAPYGTLTHFIDGVDFPTTSYNDLGAPAFGLGNSPGGFSGFTTVASRPFTTPMVVGWPDVFSEMTSSKWMRASSGTAVSTAPDSGSTASTTGATWSGGPPGGSPAEAHERVAKAAKELKSLRARE